jgi:flavin reductase (DIM6/NTAB) family NADH-FMN oxidoreductase RutF
MSEFGAVRMSLGPDDNLMFKSLMADMPSSVTIITAWDESKRPLGATLSAVMSLSMDPPMMVAAFDARSATLGALQVGRPFLIHVLGERQEELAARFAGKGADKFDGIEWGVGLRGLPQIAGAVGVIACEVADLVPGGDHRLVLGAVRSLNHPRKVEPLVYHRRALRTLDTRALVA